MTESDIEDLKTKLAELVVKVLAESTLTASLDTIQYVSPGELTKDARFILTIAVSIPDHGRENIVIQLPFDAADEKFAPTKLDVRFNKGIADDHQEFKLLAYKLTSAFTEFTKKVNIREMRSDEG
jgi:hypothetical protein